MQTHLNSVTGVPVCHYFVFSQQPLRSEFCKPFPMPRTIRHLSQGERTSHTIPHHSVYNQEYSTIRCIICQDIFLNKFERTDIVLFDKNDILCFKGMSKNSAERMKRSVMRLKTHNTLPEGVCLYAEWFVEFGVQWHKIKKSLS